MKDWTVKKAEFLIPPQDSYYLDLIFVEEVESNVADREPYYRWHWRIAPVAGQEKYSEVGCRASSQTSLTPTIGNRFGAFLKVLYGNLEVGATGSLEDLIFAKYRVKGFLKHNKQKGTDNVFCNIDTLIEDTVRKGEGLGIEGSSGKLRETINDWLTSIGKKPLEDKGDVKGTEPKTNKVPIKEPEAKKSEPAKTESKKNIKW